ncbi:MAG: tRNA (guanosine(37)-N1)-methyltransferase TrmD [Opitutia bacterium]|jgi:tRNA (guanine37-N1)-methyltransferase
MRIDLLTLFPAMADGFLRESVVGRAIDKGLVRFQAHDIRKWTKDRHQRVDDTPFGGGPGMVMSCQPLFDSVDAVSTPGCEVIYLCPDGERLSTAMAKDLASKPHLVLVSGHYEGVDERFRASKVTREVSIGDYVLTNGTLPACVLVDAVSRHIPGVLGDGNSLTADAFNGCLLSFPQFTRPAVYNGLEVPPVLLSGNHADIEKWRREQQIERTRRRRPDLLKGPETKP